MTIIALSFIPVVMTYNTSRANRALDASIHELANHTRSAHIFAREARETEGWGIKSLSSTRYAILMGEPSDFSIAQQYFLEDGITLTGDFEVWFGIGTGETDTKTSIRMLNNRGIQGGIDILITGVVEEIPRI